MYIYMYIYVCMYVCTKYVYQAALMRRRTPKHACLLIVLLIYVLFLHLRFRFI